MTAPAETTPATSTIERALQSLRITRPSGETNERETVKAAPGSYIELARTHAQTGRRYSD